MRKSNKSRKKVEDLDDARNGGEPLDDARNGGETFDDARNARKTNSESHWTPIKSKKPAENRRQKRSGKTPEQRAHAGRGLSFMDCN